MIDFIWESNENDFVDVCVKKRRWTVEELREAIVDSSSYRQVIKRLGLRPAGGNYEQVKKYIAENNFSVSHFTGKGWSKGMRGVGRPRIALRDILRNGTHFQSYKLKKRLFDWGLKQEWCEECGWNERTKDGYLPLELDHINGDRCDNRLKNLRILCPNCHSLKSTHRGRNKSKVF